MNYFIITGTSRGIGKAIAERLLESEENLVIGISRQKGIQHKNYKHFSVDLSTIEIVNNSLDDIFPVINDSQKIVLINNAGMLGQVAQVGTIDNSTIEKVFNVNFIAPVLLINEFIRRYKKISTQKLILNISSGAGKRAVDGWSSYCSSKAALDMFSLVVGEEQKIHDGGFKIFSVAPGIVDTEMQSEIRKVSVEDFSEVGKFKGYKENGDLKDPAYVAEKLIYLMDHAHDFPNVITSVRNF
jgi:benzil reductase ((S)-benzoin forming)